MYKGDIVKQCITCYQNLDTSRNLIFVWYMVMLCKYRKTELTTKICKNIFPSKKTATSNFKYPSHPVEKEPVITII